jgi:SAM-dependent methyltransferase
VNDLFLPSNYRYWQENGSSWVEEYNFRKKTQILYDIQEFMLAEYMARCTPASVLEFGCGVGRHIKYLREIPELEVFGYDQSPTMLEGIHAWAEEEWFQEHITLGEPIGKLPFPDNYFDIVFTAEVLIHSRPEDLPNILSELLRIAKWQVFHFEPAPDFVVTADAHQGCWNHDLVQEYANLGYLCEMLPRGFQIQVPYRVIFDNSRPIAPTLIPFNKLLEMENDIQPTLNQIFHLQHDLDTMKQELLNIQQERDKQQQEYNFIQKELASLQHKFQITIEERDAIAFDRANIQRERDTIVIERDNIQQERNTIIIERDNVQFERDTAWQELDRIKLTRGYRFMRVIQESRPIRLLVHILQRLFPKSYDLSN